MTIKEVLYACEKALEFTSKENNVPNGNELIFMIGTKVYTKAEFTKIMMQDNWKEILLGDEK